MAQLNAGIILAGQQPDIMGNYAHGLQTGNALNQINRQREVQNTYRQHGAGAMQGNQNALAAIAGIDPAAAQGLVAGQQGIEAQSLNMDATRQRMRILDENQARQIAADAATKTAAERQAAAAEIERAVKMGMMAQSPEQWDALMQQLGQPDMIGGFENRDVYAAQYLDVADIYKQLEGPKPASPQGKFYADQNAGLVPAGEQFKGGGTNVTVNTGDIPPGQNPLATATPRNAGTLAKELSKDDAETLKGLSDEAATASQLESLGNQLSIVSENVGYTGPGGGIYGAVDNLVGVLPGDEGSRGAFQSLAMEAQLSFTEKTKGAITDREMGMFRQAVPNLSQTPEANKDIAAVMQAGARRVQTRATFFENWARKHGSLEGAQEVWNEYMRDNPIIESDGQNGFSVRQEGDIMGYLNRLPAMSYTPDAIGKMSRNDLDQIPIEKMTGPQLDAIERRFMELGG